MGSGARRFRSSGLSVLGFRAQRFVFVVEPKFAGVYGWSSESNFIGFRAFTVYIRSRLEGLIKFWLTFDGVKILLQRAS